jgi:predicted small metal-binding protein
MSQHVACNDLIAGCKFEARAESEEELMRKVAEHAAKEHGIQEVTPELAAKVKAVIQNR